VREVLDYVQFNSRTLLDQFRKGRRSRGARGRIGYEESGRCCGSMKTGLNGYTYLEQ
jgi:arginine decarboxylase-like protein